MKHLLEERNLDGTWEKKAEIETDDPKPMRVMRQKWLEEHPDSKVRIRSVREVEGNEMGLIRFGVENGIKR